MKKNPIDAMDRTANWCNKKAETSQQPNSSPVSTPVFFLNLQCCEDERERERERVDAGQDEEFIPHQNTERKKENEQRT